MKNRFCVLQCCIWLLVLLLNSAALAQTGKEAGDAERSAAGLPYRPSLDVSAMDQSIDPCTDFYQYSCGGWKKANPIPPDKTSWGRYAQLYEDNLVLLRTILEHAAAARGGVAPIRRREGDGRSRAPLLGAEVLEGVLEYS